ncbi:pirin family protein [Shewanella eurypsychrophilus]|uniref:Pirin family protein n=1 Tax=Shewanella eurypsychrophilus TaxID=2593656 RepID=A0ABX6V8V5_9GAMM|nr:MULTISPECIES: pirin family protein [Shewanella]QFU23564.1 pirin family protein [Shewanella sp. YLB-09]QPG58789.1 pirin family protein [Shewanella eurypsychrophilus]
MIDIRLANQRGRGQFSWLSSKHSFSFADYHDTERMVFSSLRVINDDTVAAAAGFDTHGHRDMEIISYVTMGEMAHKDSKGNIQALPAGEFQLMSAGRGIYHSEFNVSQDSPLQFLQIWIEPNELGGEASYQQKSFTQTGPITAIVTPSGEAGTLKVKQDAYLYRLSLAAQQQVSYDIKPLRKVYIHLIQGQLTIGGAKLTAGDGAAITHLSQLELQAQGDKEAIGLLFDLA